MRGSHPERALEEHVERDGGLRRGERVLIACSGGPDSVALAALLAAVAKPLELFLQLAYVHHGTRASAWQDEAVVLRAGAALSMATHTAGIEPAGRDEASLRQARYEALTELAYRHDATAVATAHHAQDQTESVLLALFRGSGPDGLAGMPQRRPLADGIDLVRPLLRLDGDDLVSYCHVQGLPYAVDPTNADVAYRRNALRAALDALRPLFPGLDAAVARAAHLVGLDRSGSARAELRERVRAALRDEGALLDVDFSHVEQAVRAIESGRSGRYLMKPGVTMVIERGRFRVHREDG